MLDTLKIDDFDHIFFFKQKTAYEISACLVGSEMCIRDSDNIDKWGIPKLVVDMEFGENEKEMRKEMASSSAEILDISGFKNINTYDNPSEPGLSIHEMGTARMGNNPKESVLNKWNQMHDIPNIFVTDGSCMNSNGWGNPSLTYMALTARACDYAVKELKKRNL